MGFRVLRRMPAIAVSVLTLSAATTFLTTVGVTAASAGNHVSGAISTTDNPGFTYGDGYVAQACLNGNGTNCNIYQDKQDVFLSGLPVQASIGAGTYFFAVMVPGNQLDPNDGGAGNLSAPNDAWTNREFTVDGSGNISYSGGHAFDSNKISLFPYDDTTNPGGVYILAVCAVPQPAAAQDPPGANPSECKYDAFKVGTQQPVAAHALTITKDAAGSDTNTFTWTVKKNVDKTVVKQIGGTATFNYTVSVTNDGGTISNVKVAGTIDVFDPNVDSSNNTLPVTIDGVSDQLSDGTVCTVTNGGPQTLTLSDTSFSYVCNLSALPQGELDNTATVSWSDQVLNDGSVLSGDSANFMFKNIGFTETKVDDCVNVSDTIGGALGHVCSTDPNPTSFTYANTVSVPAWNCVTYPNTAMFTTNTTGATGSSSQSVQVCGPAKTGALTMGYWQNKNGQGIITGGAATSGVCNSGTWLRQSAPFQDLSATATCSQVATYVTNIIKAANASGSAMNPMLKAQDLATSLDVYFSDPALGGNKIGAPSAVGAQKIDLTQVCNMIDSNAGAATCGSTPSYENTSAAFGGASCLSVSGLLSYAASQSNVGGSTWYGNAKATQALAKDTFDAINNQFAFNC